MVAGGWPCQDLSIAGKQEGLKGLRSGLLRELLRVAVEAKAHTVVAENVLNLLRMREGAEFAASLEEFAKNGFPFVAWRVLNARQFGLPQNRSRLVLVASHHRDMAYTLFRDLKPSREIVDRGNHDEAAGFYWTAGTHSINYTVGYVPTIKIGSSVGIVSPPAVHYGDVVRTLSANEALALQGFDLTESDFPSRTAAHKAAGNAVARDIGRWVLDGLALAGCVSPPSRESPQIPLFEGDPQEGTYPNAGVCDPEGVTPVLLPKGGAKARNLSDFLDRNSAERLSQRAATGLLKRLDQSGHDCPSTLRSALRELAIGREG